MMIYFIVNEASGRGRAGRQWRRLKTALREKNVAFQSWTTHGPGQARQLAAQVSRTSDGLVRLVVVGGDGTINEVLNGIEDFERVALGVVPFGSGNDFVRGLGLPKQPLAALERALTADGEKRIDIGQVTIGDAAPRRFAISAGVGMDAWICAQVEASRAKAWLNRLGLGSFVYGLMTLSAVRHLATVTGSVQMETPQGILWRDLDALIFLACMNFPWEGGGVPVAPGASAMDGFFSVCLAEGLTRLETLARLPLLAMGRHSHTRGVSLHKASRVVVRLEQPLYVHTDGEVPGTAAQIGFEILPKKLRVLA